MHTHTYIHILNSIILSDCDYIISELVKQFMWSLISQIFWLKGWTYQNPYLEILVYFLFTLFHLGIFLIQCFLFDYLERETPRVLLINRYGYIYKHSIKFFCNSSECKITKAIKEAWGFKPLNLLFRCKWLPVWTYWIYHIYLTSGIKVFAVYCCIK